MSSRKQLPIVYVSYDGALDPLGASQVVPYLIRLATTGVVFTLISFEKPARWADLAAREALGQKLQRAGIRWHPLVYHRKPRVPATLWDLATGAVAVRREIHRSAALVVHSRGDVAMLISRLATSGSGVSLLYDARGFWSEERTATGSWQRGTALDRLVRRAERGNLTRADALVVLTRAAAEHLAQRRSPLPPFRVIPTCVDLQAFRPSDTSGRGRVGPVYAGSFGPRYMPAETVAFARVLRQELAGKALFLTPQIEAASRAGVTSAWAELSCARPGEVAAQLSRGRAVFFLYRPGTHTAAICPTRLAEALAVGLPVACNEGIGDLDELIENEGVGVIVRELREEGYREAAARLRALVEDPATPGRCRRLAETRFGVDGGAALYRELYETISA